MHNNNSRYAQSESHIELVGRNVIPRLQKYMDRQYRRHACIYQKNHEPEHQWRKPEYFGSDRNRIEISYVDTDQVGAYRKNGAEPQGNKPPRQCITKEHGYQDQRKGGNHHCRFGNERFCPHYRKYRYNHNQGRPQKDGKYYLAALSHGLFGNVCN